VMRLRVDGASFRDIAKHIAKKHKTKVSAVYLSRIMKEIVEEKKIRGEA